MGCHERTGVAEGQSSGARDLVRAVEVQAEQDRVERAAEVALDACHERLQPRRHRHVRREVLEATEEGRPAWRLARLAEARRRVRHAMPARVAGERAPPLRRARIVEVAAIEVEVQPLRRIVDGLRWRRRRRRWQSLLQLRGWRLLRLLRLHLRRRRLHLRLSFLLSICLPACRRAVRQPVRVEAARRSTEDEGRPVVPKALGHVHNDRGRVLRVDEPVVRPAFERETEPLDARAQPAGRRCAVVPPVEQLEVHPRVEARRHGDLLVAALGRELATDVGVGPRAHAPRAEAAAGGVDEPVATQPLQVARQDFREHRCRVDVCLLYRREAHSKGSELRVVNRPHERIELVDGSRRVAVKPHEHRWELCDLATGLHLPTIISRPLKVQDDEVRERWRWRREALGCTTTPTDVTQRRWLQRAPALHDGGARAN